jgi:hypothetical protein
MQMVFASVALKQPLKPADYFIAAQKNGVCHGGQPRQAPIYRS